MQRNLIKPESQMKMKSKDLSPEVREIIGDCAYRLNQIANMYNLTCMSVKLIDPNSNHWVHLSFWNQSHSTTRINRLDDYSE